MHTTLITLLAVAGVATAAPRHRAAPACNVDGMSGMCMSTTMGCAGGSFHAGAPPNWPCAGDDSIQCCVMGGSGGGNGGGNPPPPPPPQGGGGGGGGAGGGPIAGLNDAQSAHAWAIIGEVKAEGLPKQACLAAFATGMVESSLLIYANNGVPQSLNFPHDKVGSDHDSIGIFQQRASIYTDIAADMDAAGSARQFFKEMQGISGWQNMDVGTLCQKVQRSAYPDRYGKQVGLATNICNAGGL